jgi:hypothetical protein
MIERDRKYYHGNCPVSVERWGFSCDAQDDATFQDAILI